MSLVYHFTINSCKYNVAIIKYHLTGDESYVNARNVYNNGLIRYVPRRDYNMTYLDYHRSLIDVFRNLKLEQFLNLNDGLPDEYYLYRGLGITNINSNNIYENYKPGEIIYNPTICSTSTDLLIGNKFFLKTIPGNCGIFRILIKKNDKVLFISDERSSSLPNEQEVLLPPESKFRIISTRYIKYKDIDIINMHENLNESPFLFIDVEYIEPDYITNYVPEIVQPQDGGILPTLDNTGAYINLDFNLEDYNNVYDNYNNDNNDNNYYNGKNEGYNSSFNKKQNKLTIKSKEQIWTKIEKGKELLMKLLFDDSKLMSKLEETMNKETCKFDINFNVDMLLKLIDKINETNATRNNNKIKEELIKYLNDISYADPKNPSYYLFDSYELYELLMKKFSPQSLNQLGGKKINNGKGHRENKTKIRKNKVTHKYKNKKVKQTKKRK
jgi:hypothetical protein